MKNYLLGACLVLFSLAAQSFAAEPKLTKQLDEIRLKSGVHGIAVGVVQGERPAMFMASGFADTNKRSPISEQTQFRFGSVSKMFVALSIMKLVEDGALTLNAPLKTLAPEIKYSNPYATDYPLRVVHLINHSTGWDAMRFAENAPQPSPPISITQALELLPESRTSRWPPGTRSAYNNTGPLVAAYLVEKFSGMPYEAFVKQHFLTPLGMQNTDYFYTDNYRQHAATLYVGAQPTPYAHINNRAAGAMNSSIADMITFIRFLNRQGSDPNLLKLASFTAMQNAIGSTSAQAGIEVAHLPGLQQFRANGFVFFGHEGSVRGGSALLAYQPDLKVGYVIAVNGEGPAIGPIHQYLSNMLTAQNAASREQKNQAFNDAHSDLSGWYVNISPISQLVAPFQKLIPWKLTVASDSAFIKSLIGGPPRQLKAGSNGQFLQDKTYKVVALPLTDPIAGKVLHYGPNTLKPVSAVSALLPLFIALCWILSGVLALLLATWWLPRLLLKKQSITSTGQLKIWPLLTFSFAPICLVMLLVGKGSLQINSLLGQPSWLTIGIMLCTVLFFISSFWSAFKWWQLRISVGNGFTFWHATLLVSLNLVVSIYLFVNGLIGIRLWA